MKKSGFLSFCAVLRVVHKNMIPFLSRKYVLIGWEHEKKLSA